MMTCYLRGGLALLASFAGFALQGASAQQQEQVVDGGVFRIYQAGGEVGRETFTRTRNALESNIVIPALGARLAYRTSYDAVGTLTAFEANIYRLPADTLLVHYQARVGADSIRWTQTGAGGQSRSGAGAGPADAVAASQSLAVFADLLTRAGSNDTTFTLWSPERGATLPVKVTPQGDSAKMAIAGIPLTIRRGADGKVNVIESPAERVRVERATTTDLPPLPGLEPPKHDYSAAPGAPYRTVEADVPVTPSSGEPFELVGTLTVPTAGSAPYPAVLMITGSGAQDRDESLWPLVPTYRPFHDIADRLGREGIAVLRVDDRGFAPSGGLRDSATMLDFADDVRAELKWLRARSEVDADRIALAGHSEGGVVGPMVAASDSRVAALVIMAGTAKNGEKVLEDQLTWPVQMAAGISQERKAKLIDSLLTAVRNDTANASPWVRHFRTYDPLPTARRVKQPVLILQGELDRQVSAGQADTLAAALRAGGNRDVTVHKFPGLNHLFLKALSDGSPAEYAAIKETTLPADVLDTLAAWLKQHLGRR